MRIITKLNTKLDLSELLDYYNSVKNNFDHLKWTKEKNLESTVSKWRDDSNVKGIYGWAIDSNLENINGPCPPLNISNKPKVGYRNTDLAFGIINHLQSIFYYGYRWSISVLPPEGYVSLHSDDEKNITVWIPIINPIGALFMFKENDELVNYHLPADGSIYVVDTRFPHCTKNESEVERVLLSFRCTRDNLQNLLAK